MMRVIVAQLSVQFIAPIRSSVEIRAHDFAQDFEHLVDERGGGRGGDVTRAQCRRTARPGDAVEVGEVSDKELPQALQLRDQLPARTLLIGWSPPPRMPGTAWAMAPAAGATTSRMWRSRKDADLVVALTGVEVAGARGVMAGAGSTARSQRQQWRRRDGRWRAHWRVR